MKAQVWSYSNEKVACYRNVIIPNNYDGDPYGDTIPFVIHSNQIIVTDPDKFIIPEGL